MSLTAAQVNEAFAALGQPAPSNAILTSITAIPNDVDALNFIISLPQVQSTDVPITSMFDLALGHDPTSATLSSMVSGGAPLTAISDAFVSSSTFANEYNGGVILPPTTIITPANNSIITALFINGLGHPPSPATLASFNGLTLSAAFLAFTTSSTVAVSAVVNQSLLNLLETALSLPITPPPPVQLTLTVGVDSPTQGFTTGVGATATAAGSAFIATPGSNPPLGVINTLQAGDVLLATGAAAGDTTLTYTAISTPLGINPPLATSVTMTGVNAAFITSNTNAGDAAGFSGDITGLTTVVATTLEAGNPITLGAAPASLGLNTALTSITLNSEMDFTAFMAAGAFASAPAGTIHMTGFADTVNLFGGEYGTLTVDSGGTAGNDLVLNAATPEIDVTGAEALVISGTALNIDTVHTFNGSAATGDLTVIFNGAGHVAATGGSGDDTFVFLTTPGGGSNFNPATSSVNGGGGTNELVIQADTGQILGGNGSEITNIQTIVHTTTDTNSVVGPLTADLAGMGSATTFDLAGDYVGGGVDQNVTVTDITDAQTVEYSGASLGDLTLVHQAPVAGFINFEMNGGVTLDQLTVAAGLDELNIISTGGDNVISNISTVDNNITVAGDTHLQLGSSFGTGYGLLGGVIDATAAPSGPDTGGVEAWLSQVGLNGGNPSVTFNGGTGGDTVHLANNGGDVVNFQGAGGNTVAFGGSIQVSAGSLNDNVVGAHIYNNVTGFTAGDAATVSIGGLAGVTPSYTDNGAHVVGGDPTSPLNYLTPGDTVNATGEHDNFIFFATPSTSGGSVANGFGGVGGAIGAGAIEVFGGATELYAFSYYDSTHDQAVLGVVESVAGGATGQEITAASPLGVIGLIHESAADYASFTAGLHFVA